MQPPAMPSQESRDVADIHQRLNSITRQIDQISRPAPRNDAPRGEASARRADRRAPVERRHLAPRCAAVADFKPGARGQAPMQDRQRQTEMVERAAAQVYRPSPPLSPASLRFGDRRNRRAPERTRWLRRRGRCRRWRRAPRRWRPTRRRCRSLRRRRPVPDFSSLERHLLKITSQIEALQRPDHVEQSIAAFRSELAEIRLAITEAMPRRAIESIENEIRSLSRRIEDSRQSGTDGQTLAGIERALGEIYDVLRSLKPAEQLAGYDDAIRNLGAKLDLILRSNDDPVARCISSKARSRRFARSSPTSPPTTRWCGFPKTCTRCRPRSINCRRSRGNSESLRQSRTAHRRADLDDRNAASGRQPATTPNISKARCATCPTASTACRSATTTHRRSPISNSACRICWNGSRPPAIPAPAISAGSRTGCRTSCAISKASMPIWWRSPTTAAAASAPQPIGLRHRRCRQARIVRHPFQPVGNRSPHPGIAGDRPQHARPCGRSAGDDRRRSARGSRRTLPRARPAPAKRASKRRARRCRRRAPRRRPMCRRRRAAGFRRSRNRNCQILPAAPGAFRRRAARIPCRRSRQPPVAAPMPPRAISEILEPHAAPPRTAIAPELPPDHPLEPGTRPAGRASSPSERIAASESVISEIPQPPRSRSAHRASSPPRAVPRRPPPPRRRQREGGEGRCESRRQGHGQRRHRQGKAGSKEPSTITSKIRSLLVGASVVVIVLGTFKMAMTLLDTGSAPPNAGDGKFRRAARRRRRLPRTAPGPRRRRRRRPP